jgi:hypothetical protein
MEKEVDKKFMLSFPSENWEEEQKRLLQLTDHLDKKTLIDYLLIQAEYSDESTYGRALMLKAAQILNNE